LAAGYDGTIRIDTRVDEKGFNEGVKRLGGTLKNIATAILSLLKTAAIGIVVLSVAFVGLIAVVGKWSQELTETLHKNLSVTTAMRDRVVQLKGAFDGLKGAVMATGATLLNALAPVLLKIIDWLVKAINWVTMFVAALTGQKTVMQYVSGAVDSAAGSTAKLAKATKDTEKAAKGALAAFDEINVLQMESADEADTGGGAGGNVIMREVAVPEDFIKDSWIGFKQWFKEDIIDVMSGWLADVWKNPFAEGTNPIQNLLETLGLEENPIKLFWEWGISEGTNPIQNLLTLLGINASNPLRLPWKLAEPGTNPIQNLLETLGLEENPIKLLWELGTKDGSNPIKNLLDETKRRFDEFDWNALWTDLQIGAANAVLRVIESVSNLKARINETFDGIKNFAKGTINSIIDFINGMIRGITTGINAVIRALNTIKIDIPATFLTPAYSFGLNIPTVTAPQIPRLATGAVIPPNAEFAAILGDQRSGRNLEAPEGLIRQIIQEELGNIQTDIEIKFAGSLGALVRELKPYIDKENTRIGNSLVRRSAA